MRRVRLASAVLSLFITFSLAAQNVAVMGAVSPQSWLDDVRAKVAATGMFAQVDAYNLYLAAPPTLAQMQNYCAILVFTDYGIQDPVTFGNNLADYIDGGGGVVAATFATASVPIPGRFQTDNYYVIQPGGQLSGSVQTLGTIHNTCHPVLQNVDSFNGGSSSYRHSPDNLHPDAVRIADWTDGLALIAERSINGTRRIDLGFYPPSSDVRSDFWDPSTDGTQIIANALQYVSSCAAAASADLAITNTDSADPVVPGSNITYTVDVDNLGPFSADTVVVTSVLPAGTVYVSAAGENATCSFDSGSNTVSCTLASLASCADEVITIVVTVPVGTPSGTILTHTSSVTAATGDPAAGNNLDAESTTVVLPADLVLTKTALTDPAVAGENLAYTIDVDNVGAETAADVVITDAIPAGTTFVSATGEASSCSFAGGTVTCTLASLAGGQDEVISLVVAVNADVAAGTVLTNTASATSTPADATPANNEDSVETTVTARADLSIAKSGPASFTAGVTLSYTIDIANAGPSHAATVELTDAIPAETTFVSLSAPAGFTCTTPTVGATGTVTCTAASLAPGTAAFTLQVAVDGNPSLATISNTASVTTTTPDPDSTNDTATTAANATPADLVLAKTAASPSVIAGETLTWTIDVDNAGTAPATSIVVTDVLPAGTAFVSATGEAASCAFAGGTVTCTLASLAGGADEIITLVVTVNADVPAGSTISNTATASSSADDPTPADNQDSVDVSVTASADLSLTKSGPASFSAGETLSYTIELTNAGPSNAATVELTDAIPAETTFVSLTAPAGFTCTTPAVGATGTVTCSTASMVPGTASFALQVAVTAAPTLPAISNTVSVTAGTSDPDATNNSASTVAGATPADLALTKTAASPSVIAGETLTWTIDVDNTGTAAATGVVVTDALPSETTFLSATGEAGSCTFAGGTVTCTLASLAGGTDEIITLVVTVNADVAAGTTISNTATASSSDDMTPANNQDSADVTVTANADLSLTKSGPASFAAGETLSYTIELTNAGPSNAATVELTDAIPAETTFVALTAAAGFTCTTPAVGATGTVTCTNASMAPGTATFALQVAVVDAPSLTAMTNTVSVTAATPDSDATNNSASTVAGATPADLVLAKTASSGSVVAGGTLTWTIDVDNIGTTAATSVVITDVLPAGTTFVSATGETATCSEAGGTVTCTLPSLAGGADEAITIEVMVNPDAADSTTLSNTATVTSTPEDATPANNQDTANTTVETTADLSITKSGPLSFSPYETLSYTIEITNDGPSNAATVAMTDVLPAGTTFVSVTAPAEFSCTTPAVGASGTVTCTSASMAPGTATFVLQVAVGGNVSATTIANTASVSSSTPDPDGVDTSATAVATLAAAAVAGVPSLSEWGLLALMMSLLALGALRLKA